MGFFNPVSNTPASFPVYNGINSPQAGGGGTRTFEVFFWVQQFALLNPQENMTLYKMRDGNGNAARFWYRNGRWRITQEWYNAQTGQGGRLTWNFDWEPQGNSWYHLVIRTRTDPPGLDAYIGRIGVDTLNAPSPADLFPYTNDSPQSIRQSVNTGAGDMCIGMIHGQTEYSAANSGNNLVSFGGAVQNTGNAINNNSHWQGGIAEVRLWYTRRTDAEINEFRNRFVHSALYQGNGHYNSSGEGVSTAIPAGILQSCLRFNRGAGSAQDCGDHLLAITQQFGGGLLTNELPFTRTSQPDEFANTHPFFGTPVGQDIRVTADATNASLATAASGFREIDQDIGSGLSLEGPERTLLAGVDAVYTPSPTEAILATAATATRDYDVAPSPTNFVTDEILDSTVGEARNAEPGRNANLVPLVAVATATRDRLVEPEATQSLVANVVLRTAEQDTSVTATLASTAVGTREVLRAAEFSDLFVEPGLVGVSLSLVSAEPGGRADIVSLGSSLAFSVERAVEPSAADLGFSNLLTRNLFQVHSAEAGSPVGLSSIASRAIEFTREPSASQATLQNEYYASIGRPLREEPEPSLASLVPGFPVLTVERVVEPQPTQSSVATALLSSVASEVSADQGAGIVFSDDLIPTRDLFVSAQDSDASLVATLPPPAREKFGSVSGSQAFELQSDLLLAHERATGLTSAFSFSEFGLQAVRAESLTREPSQFAFVVSDDASAVREVDRLLPDSLSFASEATTVRFVFTTTTTDLGHRELLYTDPQDTRAALITAPTASVGRTAETESLVALLPSLGPPLQSRLAEANATSMELGFDSLDYTEANAVVASANPTTLPHFDSLVALRTSLVSSDPTEVFLIPEPPLARMERAVRPEDSSFVVSDEASSEKDAVGSIGSPLTVDQFLSYNLELAVGTTALIGQNQVASATRGIPASAPSDLFVITSFPFVDVAEVYFVEPEDTAIGVGAGLDDRPLRLIPTEIYTQVDQQNEIGVQLNDPADKLRNIFDVIDIVTTTIPEMTVQLEGAIREASLLLGEPSNLEDYLSVLDIWNTALVRLGASTIDSLSSNQNEAVKMRAVWDQFRVQFLVDHTWNGAKKTKEIASFVNSDGTTVTPPLRWRYTYALPDDYLRAITLAGMANEPRSAVIWEVEVRANDIGDQRVLHTNASPNTSTGIELEYIFDIGDKMNLLGPKTRQALAKSLAWYVAENFGKSTEDIMQLEKEAKQAMSAAKGIDGQEMTAVFFAETGLSAVRDRERFGYGSGSSGYRGGYY